MNNCRIIYLQKRIFSLDNKILFPSFHMDWLCQLLHEQILESVKYEHILKTFPTTK